jgi:periplasmic mercuric ion binding protein
MKNTIIIVCALFMMFASAGVQAQKENKKKTETVKISASMHCQTCANNIETNLNFESGVKKITADFTINLVVIEYNPKRTTPEKLLAHIIELGYKAELVVE